MLSQRTSPGSTGFAFRAFLTASRLLTSPSMASSMARVCRSCSPLGMPRKKLSASLRKSTASATDTITIKSNNTVAGLNIRHKRLAIFLYITGNLFTCKFRYSCRQSIYDAEYSWPTSTCG